MSDRWGRRWLERCEVDEAIGVEGLELGRTYALHDWQLELHLEPGRAEAIARSGPRVTHEVTGTHPTLDDDEARLLVDLLAGSGTQTAALFDRELEPDLLDRAAEAGLDLLPRPDRLRLECSCPADEDLCKHRAALVHLLGEAFDEQPFDLLLFRGLAHRDLVERVAAVRRGESGDAAPDDADASPSTVADPPAEPVDPAAVMQQAWAGSLSALPRPLPAGAAEVPDWGSPPDTAPFTGDGLRELVADVMERARGVLDGGTSGLDESVAADVARRIARLDADDDAEAVRRLARLAGLSTLEARARARAWTRAGAGGVEAVSDPIETVREGDVTLRRISDGRWYAFAKEAGRWQLDRGPFDNIEDAGPSGGEQDDRDDTA